MKPREYCCCAIPLVNAGIYATLTEQIVLAIVVGTLAISTPSIVGAATPSFAPWIFAIICYVAAGIQVFGFLGVAQEKAIMYRRYVTLHSMITVAAFAVAAVWIAISASRHSTAQTNCENTFFGSTTNTEGTTMCNIFGWVDVGIMGGLWVLFAIAQLYFYVVVSSYASAQQRDHEKYDSVYDPTNPLTSDIPMTSRNDPWDSRPSMDEDAGYGHARQTSDASVMGDKGYGGYPPARQPSNRTGVSQPPSAYTQDPGPTPNYNNNYFTGRGEDINRPPTSQAHPAEGSFRRKTPRLQKSNPADFDYSFFSAGR